MNHKRVVALCLALMLFTSVPVQTALAAQKEETVYANLDNSSNTEKITVSDWLKNTDGESQVTDASDLENIKNVKSSVVPVKSGDNIVWAAEGEDVYYQGETNKELPISLKISYTLDGKAIEPKELIGKSGHVCINVQYLNSDKGMASIGGKQKEIYTPFTMASVVLLPNDTFKNVKVDDAKIFDDGNTRIVMGFGFPGLKESLGIDELDIKDAPISIPESFEIEADVENYELSSIITVATPNVLDMGKADSVDAIDKIQDGVKQLTDAGSQLVDGTSELSSGMNTFSSKFNEYLGGVRTLNDGMGKATNGIGTLCNGIQSLNDGAQALKSGADQLAGGGSALAEGADKLYSGAASLSSGGSKLSSGASAAYNGAASLNSGLSQLDSTVGSMQSKFQGEVNDFNQGKGKVNESLASILSKVNNVQKDFSNNVKDSGYNSGYNQGYADALSTISAAQVLLTNSVAKPASPENQQILKMIAASLTSTNPALAAQLTPLLTAMAKDDDLTNGIIAFIPGDTLNAKLAAMQNPKFLATLKPLMNILSDEKLAQEMLPLVKVMLKDPGLASRMLAVMGDQQIANDMGELLGAIVNSKNSALAMVTKLLNSAAELKSATSRLESGSSQLRSGVSAVSSGAYALGSGASDMRSGISSLQSGAQTLNNGLTSLQAGVTGLADGSAKLNDGALQLFAVGKQLKDGTQKLSDNGAKLSEAAAKLSDGANKLFEGATKLNVEGIQKIADKLDGKAEDLSDRVKAIEDRSENYKSFTKMSGNDGSVKFILKTAEQKAEAKKESAAPAVTKAETQETQETQETPNFWQRISTWVTHLFKK